MEIHLIRHGKTLANEMRLYCGEADLPLSENGINQITFLKDKGVYPNADIFFTSPSLRAIQTLDIIHGAVSREEISDISEYKFGIFEMKSYNELKNIPDYQLWITDTTGTIGCPGGESKNMFKQRTAAGFNRITNRLRESKQKSAFVVCHGGVIVSIMESLLPGIGNFYEWQPDPGCGYTLTYTLEGIFKTYKKI